MSGASATNALQRPIRAALVDISGTLHVGKDAIPGAAEACRKLFRHGVKVLFLTNTSKMSSASLLRQLREVGFDETAVPDDAVMTSVSATRQYLLENHLRPYCLVEDELVDSDFDGVDMSDPNCVLVGLAPSKFNYHHLNEAYRILSRSNSVDANEERPRLIAIHRGTHYRDAGHQLSLGPGGFVTLLEQTTGATAHVMGKPSKEFYSAALSKLGVDDPLDAVMVGDDVVGDVKGALDAGLRSAILVRTGKYVDGDESGRKTDGVLPTLTLDSIGEAVDYISSRLER